MVVTLLIKNDELYHGCQKNMKSWKNLEFEKNKKITLNFEQNSLKSLKKHGILNNFYMLST